MLRFTLILLLLMNNAVRGQTPMGLNKDSLRWILMTHPADTAKVATLNLLGHQFGNAQPDSAILYFQEADRLSRELNFGRYNFPGRVPWVTILSVGVLLLTAALLTGTFLYYRQRRLLGLQAKEALRVHEENIRLKALLEEQVNEQHRISQEMQKGIGSELASLLSLSQAGDPTTITRMQETTEQLIRRTNEIAWMLDHEENDLRSLIANIRLHATQLLEQANIDLRLDIDDDIPEMAVTQAFRRDVYLIVKEAVHNAVRHSGASVVEISIHFDAGEMTIVVRDNGKGIYKAGGNHWGNGMKNMQRRVEQIDGRMEITAGAGTAITIVSPLPFL